MQDSFGFSHHYLPRRKHPAANDREVAFVNLNKKIDSFLHMPFELVDLKLYPKSSA